MEAEAHDPIGMECRPRLSSTQVLVHDWTWANYEQRQEIYEKNKIVECLGAPASNEDSASKGVLIGISGLAPQETGYRISSPLGIPPLSVPSGLVAPTKR